MKKGFLFKAFVYFLFLSFLLFFQTFSAFGQTIPCPTCPPNPESGNPSDWSIIPSNAFQVAYRTNGYWPNAEIPADWQIDVKWQTYSKQNGWVDLPQGTFPPPTDDGQNQTYILIRSCDVVSLKEPLNYKNKLTLQVCGELYIENMVIDVTVPTITGQVAPIHDSSNNVTFSAKWTYIPPEGSPNFVSSVGVLLAKKKDIEDGLVDLYETDVNGNFLNSYEVAPSSGTGSEISFSVSVSGIEAGVEYSWIPFAVAKDGSGNIVGIGYGEYLNNILVQSSKSFEKEEEPIVATVNNLTLILCHSCSIFKVSTLTVGNNADLFIDGIFYVNEIAGINGTQTQNLCITGTGVIMNYDGYTPLVDPQFANGCDEESVLPINLLSFTPKIMPDRVSLNWTTASEINNDFFTIERSRDLYGWEVLGFVDGAGNSSVPLDYSFADLRPLDGLGYYRLKQTDFDGQFKYYGPIAAHYDLGLEGLDFKVMKNYSHWVIAVPNDGVYQVEVYNLQGHRLFNEKVENNLSIPAPQGAVVIRVTDGFERSASRVVM